MQNKRTDRKVTSVDDLFDQIVNDAIDETLTPQQANADRTYLMHPVSMLEFACSDKFLGLGNDLFKKIQVFIEYIDQPHIREVYLVLGKGSGKSTLAQVCLLYGIYQWSCFRDPYEYFKLMHTAKPACVNVSTSRDQARDVIFEGCLHMVQHSPFFVGNFEAFKDSIRFASGITLYAGHGNASAWLGYMTFVGVMDEVEFMVDSSHRSQAAQLYNALRGSLKTRFPQHYKLVCISSAKERYSFLMRKAQAVLKIGKEIEIV